MTSRFHPFGWATACLLLAGLCAVAPPASAQAHVQTQGDYVMRVSTVSAANLPSAMLQEYGISSSANTAVLNVTVQQQAVGGPRNVPAQVQVQARNLLGVETSVDMRNVVANDFVSYLGVYNFLPREVLDFYVSAHPEGAAQPITLQFRDRLGQR
jgi:hypothetical protein